MGKQGEVHVDLSEEQWATVKAALDGEIADLCAEVARLQTALEGAEARDRLRGEALEALIEYSNHHSSCILEHHAPGVRDCGCGYVAALRAAIDISPKDAREKEGR